MRTYSWADEAEEEEAEALTLPVTKPPPPRPPEATRALETSLSPERDIPAAPAPPSLLGDSPAVPKLGEADTKGWGRDIHVYSRAWFSALYNLGCLWLPQICEKCTSCLFINLIQQCFSFSFFLFFFFFFFVIGEPFFPGKVLRVEQRPQVYYVYSYSLGAFMHVY